MSSESNDVLLMILINLRNAQATFDPDSGQCKDIRDTARGHLESMRANGHKVALTKARLAAFGFPIRSDDGLVDALSNALSKLAVDESSRDA